MYFKFTFAGIAITTSKLVHIIILKIHTGKSPKFNYTFSYAVPK